MQAARRIELTLDNQQPQTKDKLISLLKKYNATMGFVRQLLMQNENDNMFEVDLEVKFDSVDQKDKFVRAYFTKLRQSNSAGPKGPVLGEIRNEPNSSKQQDDDIKELRRQKEHINAEAMQAVDRQYYSANHNGSVAPANSTGSLSNTPSRSHHSKESGHHFQTPPNNSIAMENGPEKPLNYELLDHKLEMTVNQVFRMLFTRNFYSESRENSIKIVGDTFEEQQRQADVMPYVPLFGSQSPSTINPASSDRQRLNAIREINGEIAELQEHSSASLGKYNVEEIIEEEHSEISEDSEIDKKKKDHFKFLEERIKGKGSKKPAREPRKIVFDEGKFRQFLQLEKNKIEDMFAQMKRNVTIGAPKDTLSNSAKKPVGNNNKLRQISRFSSQPSQELWRQELTQTRSILVDNNEQFSKRFYEVFESRITAENRSMSSTELVSYFKYLIANAKKLYVDFARTGSFRK